MSAESEREARSSGRSQGRETWLSAAPLLLAHVALLATFDLAKRPILTLLVLGVAAVALVWASRRLSELRSLPTVSVLLVAALLRLLMLPLPHSLSDDLLRYVWDGRVVNAGENPYLLAPDDPALTDLRGPEWEVMPHRDVPTVYPPVALGLFSIAARFDTSSLALKVLLTGFDLLTCLLLIRMAAAIGLPRSRVVWYAWNPLVTLEIAGMGHLEGLGVLLVVTTMFWLVRRPARPVMAALAAGAAVLTKLVPVAAVPLWARATDRWPTFLAVVGLTAGVGLAPVFLSTSGAPPGMVRYAVSWEFNGPIYEPLWRLSERLDVHGMVENALDRRKENGGDHEFWNHFYPFNYPQLHAKAVLTLALALTLVWIWKGRDPVAGTGAVFGALLLFSATVYPWYLLWVLPSAALVRQPAYLLLSLLIPLSYLPQFSEVELMPWVFAAIWLPFAIVLARRPTWSIG